MKAKPLKTSYPRADFSDDPEYVTDSFLNPKVIPVKIRAALSNGHFDYYFQHIRKENRFNELLKIREKMSKQDFWHYVRKFWCHGHFSDQNGVDAFIRVMTAKGVDRKDLMKSHEQNFIKTLADKVELYKGGAKNGDLSGWSWTLSEEIARKFAAKYHSDGDGIIHFGTCSRNSIIAYFDFEGMHEEEVVVDPSKVTRTRFRGAENINHEKLFGKQPWQNFDLATAENFQF